MDEIVVQQAQTGLSGTITVPGDKSISHRALILGSLASGETEIHNLLDSGDCRSTAGIFKSLKAELEYINADSVRVRGRGINGLEVPDCVLDAGNSGTTIRLMTGVLAGQNFSSVITGDDSLKKRPMLRVVKPLRTMGAKITGPGNGNFAPLKITGSRLKPIVYTLPIASAQVKSAILLAGLLADGTTEVIETNPSRDHTERMFEHFRIPFERTKKSGRITNRVFGPVKQFKAAEVTVPGDISSAAFFIVAGLIVPDSEIVIQDVGVNPLRTGFIEVLQQMGGNIEIRHEKEESGEPVADIHVRSSELKGINIRPELVPRIIDEIPILSVAASLASGKTIFRGASELKVKETDRIISMVSNLRKFGVAVEERSDGLEIQGSRYLIGANVQSFGDHRTAMSMVIAGLVAREETTVIDTACIRTSFPGFMDALDKLLK